MKSQSEAAPVPCRITHRLFLRVPYLAGPFGIMLPFLRSRSHSRQQFTHLAKCAFLVHLAPSELPWAIGTRRESWYRRARRETESLAKYPEPGVRCKRRSALRLIQVAFLLLAFSSGMAQWSTTSNIDSVLFVCPGFFPGVISNPDGSSVILGALSNSIYLQKLDPRGYSQWPNPVLAHYNDSSYIGAGLFPIESWGGWVSDGDGGAIFCWMDRRGAYYEGSSVRTSSLFAQSVDKQGNVRWQAGGVRVKGPETGLKVTTSMIDDGVGGAIIAWADNGFSFPGSPDMSRITVLRLDADAHRLWEVEVDSFAGPIPTSLYYLKVLRLQDRVIVQYQGGDAKVLDMEGNYITVSEPPNGAIAVHDSALYALASIDVGQTNDTTFKQVTLRRLDKEFNTIYSGTYYDFYFGEAFPSKTPIVPDGIGGVYSVSSFIESFAGQWTGYAHVQHFDGSNFWDSVLVVSGIDRPYAANAPDGGLAVFNFREGTYVQKIALDKRIVWPEPVEMLSSTLDVVNQTPATDLNGGIILAFWKTLGGIYAQHSGRDGNLGVLTSISDERAIPSEFSLRQNFPNPFNSHTTIEFFVPTPAHISLHVYNLLGQTIAEVVNASLSAGSYRVLFDASNIASGVYLCTMTGGGTRQVRKMSLLR